MKNPLHRRRFGVWITGFVLGLPWVMTALGLVLALYVGQEVFVMVHNMWRQIFGEAAMTNREYRVTDEETGEAEWMSREGLDRNLTNAGYKDMGVKKGRTHRHVMLDKETGAEVEGTGKDVEHFVPEDWNS